VVALNLLESPIRPSRANFYSGSPLDRAVERRDDDAWIAAALENAASLFVPVWRGRHLARLDAQGNPQAVFLRADEAEALRADAQAWVFLGLLEGKACFALEIGGEDPLAFLPEGSGAFEDLRNLAGTLPAPEAAVLAHARAMMHWRARHRFCGVCGHPCEPRSAGHIMRCTHCGAEHFPRTDPAVIMLVVRGERALLGHSHRFPRLNMYSTLAGFVEPGETLEEAVAREVWEETGVRVGRVFYHSSQPWPFPASIMLGFYAEGLSEEIRIDPQELRDARWFTREEIRNHKALGFALPRGDSIARRLIEDWLAAG
jgi:NAD+ diphosphatase